MLVFTLKTEIKSHVILEFPIVFEIHKQPSSSYKKKERIQYELQ